MPSTILGLAPIGGINPLDPIPYSQQTSANLIAKRLTLDPNDPQQAVLAPYEHRAFAREWTIENPFVAIPSLLASIPAYTAGKALGLIKGNSTPASLDQLAEGYRGLGEGVGTVLKKFVGS